MEKAQFGKRIKQLRKQAGLTQREVAKLVNIDYTYMSKIENGIAVPGRDVIQKLTEILSGEIDELLSLAGKVPSDIIEQFHNNPEIIKSLREGKVKGKGNNQNSRTATFGRKLRELREGAGLTQEELAEKVGVDFTYLSKIENGAKPAPSQKVIYKLAGILNADADELLAISGKLPSEIIDTLQNQKILHALRSSSIYNFNRRDSSMHKFKSLFNMRGLSRVALPVMLVVAVAASLVFSAPLPAKALDFTFGGATSVTTGNAMTFSVKIDVQDIDKLPIIASNVMFSDKPYDSTTYENAFTGLPLTATSSAVTVNSVSGPTNTISVSATTGAGWGQASTTGRTGYGYGYSISGGTWTTGYHNFTDGTAYGYGYNSYVGATSITYTITWTPPSSWPAGTYYITASVSGDSDKSIAEYQSFTISAASAPYVPPTVTPTPAPAPAPAPVETAPGVWDTTNVTTSTGTFTTNVTVQDEKEDVTLTISENTTGTTSDGQPITSIEVKEVAPETLPEPPTAITGQQNVLVMTYDIDVNNGQSATFDEPITLTFTYDPANLPEGVAEEDLVVAWYDEVAGEWVVLPTVVDTVNKTLTVQVTHLSKWAVMASVTVEPAVVEEPVVEEEPVIEEEPVVEEEEPVVEEEPVIEEEPVVEEEEPVVEPTGGIAWWVWLIIGIAIVAVLVIAYIYWWKPRHAA